MSDGRSLLLTLVVVECECIFLLDGFIIIRGEGRFVKDCYLSHGSKSDSLPLVGSFDLLGNSKVHLAWLWVFSSSHPPT